ncbi:MULTISPECIES: hypothetical protein [Moorena]|nr:MULTISPECIES: hypothetical protein [Moorena]
MRSHKPITIALEDEMRSHKPITIALEDEMRSHDWGDGQNFDD